MKRLWCGVLAVILSAGLCINGFAAGKVKYESQSNDAGSTVLYGTSDGGDSIVRIKTTADGTIVTDAGTKFVLLSDAFETLTVNSATPAVTAGDRFITANTNPTSITNFTGGQEGEEISIIFTDNNTTIVAGATIFLQSVGNFTPVAGNAIQLRLKGSVWYEEGRSGAGGVESDTLQTVTTRGNTTTTSILSTNSTAFTAGEDVAGGSPNVAGQIKMFSAGDNAFYNTFTSGTNTANATYTFPTAMPAGDYVLQSTNAGVMSWVSGVAPIAHNVLSASHGDTVAASPVLGDLIYGDATPNWTKLAGNTTVTPKVLRQIGTGAVSAIPAWTNDYEDKDFLINDPSSIAAVRTLFHVDAKKYPNGIKIVHVDFTVPIKTAYTLVYEEWTNSSEVMTKVSDIESLSTDANHIYAEAEDASIDDSDIAADNYVRITIPATASDDVQGKIIFYAK